MRIPFVDKGRSMDGADCWGLVCLVYKQELGITLPDYLDVYANVEDYATIAAINSVEALNFPSVPIEDIREFDVITLRIRNAPIHVAIATGDGFMLHCERGINTAHVRIDGKRWGNRIVGVNRYE